MTAVDPDTRCTYCGMAGHRASRCPMRPAKAAAHALLDRAQAGAPIGPDAITAALTATGDIGPARGAEFVDVDGTTAGVGAW